MLLIMLIFFGTPVERTRVSLLAPKITPMKSSRLKKKIKNQLTQTTSHDTVSQIIFLLGVGAVLGRRIEGEWVAGRRCLEGGMHVTMGRIKW